MELVKDIHKSEYGEQAQVVVCTPGRFHLIGEHSWFFKDKTLSMGVNFPVYVAVSLRDDDSFHFYFPQLKDRKKIPMLGMKFRKEDRWSNSIKAIIHGFLVSDFELKGMNFTIYSDILPSAGFGINTAMKVGAAYAINELYDFDCSENEILQVITRGNLQFLNTNSYLSDIFTAIHSSEKSLVLTDYATKSYELLPFDYSEKKIILVDAKVPRVNIWNEESIREPESALLLGELKERKSYVRGGWRYEENPHEVNLVLSILPEMIHKKLNSVIKRVAEKTGINRPVVCTEQRGLKKETKTVPLYELMHTHTARHTFVSIMARMGVPKDTIKIVTAHSNDAIIDRVYLHVTAEDKGRTLINTLRSNSNLQNSTLFGGLATTPTTPTATAPTIQTATPTEALLIERLEQKAVEAHKMEQRFIEQMEDGKRQTATREAFILETGMTPEDYNKSLEETDHEPTPEEVLFVQGLWE